jgi:hypothetical protein
MADDAARQFSPDALATLEAELRELQTRSWSKSDRSPRRRHCRFEAEGAVPADDALRLLAGLLFRSGSSATSDAR